MGEVHPGMRCKGRAVVSGAVIKAVGRTVSSRDRRFQMPLAKGAVGGSSRLVAGLSTERGEGVP